jgi:Cu2+-exporting ATPase
VSGEEGGPANALLLRLGLGVFITINIMVFNWLIFWRHVFDASLAEPAATEYGPLASLVSYLLLFLCSIVVAALGAPMAADVMAAKRIDADVLILIGVVSAFIVSAWNTFRGDFHLYYDTAAVILVLVTLGKYLDAAARTRATEATGSLLADLPGEAHAIGDIVRVRPGEIIGVDGLVREGTAHVDEATLTGESQPRSVRAQDNVLAGSIALDGALLIEATAVGRDRVIALMQRMLDEARLKQPRIALLADRVAQVFVPAVVVLAIAVFAHRGLDGRWIDGLMDGLCVLLISCPCALGLAAPLATWTALGRAAKHGIVIDSGRTLERASHVRCVCMDKTGTLTRGRMTVESIDSDNAPEALRLAASLERASAHPIAAAFADKAGGMPLSEPRDVTTLPGRGLRGEVDGRMLELVRDEGELLCFILREGERVIARFTLAERLRDDAMAAVDALRADGMDVTMLTGDRPAAAQRIAEELGIAFEAAMLPQDKVSHLESRRRRETPNKGVAPNKVIGYLLQHVGGNQKSIRHFWDGVAMVGDGINDAPVLAAADVAISVGSATDLARQAGQVHLVGEALAGVPLTFRLARHAMRRIRLNLVWAFGYNSVGIALAAAGYLTPVVAAGAMLGSSLLIVLTSKSAGDVGP